MHVLAAWLVCLQEPTAGFKTAEVSTHRQVFSLTACSGGQRTRFSCPARTHRLHCECSPLDRYLDR